MVSISPLLYIVFEPPLSLFPRYTDPMDRELEKLEHYLRSVVDAKYDDIRPELDQKFQLTKRLPPDQ